MTGLVAPVPLKSPNLLDSNGKFFERSKPQYESQNTASFLVATDYGILNDGTGDQTNAINSLLGRSTPVFFPAGVYLVRGTVHVPVGSVIVGEGWSQIMATGPFFEDETTPHVMIQYVNVHDSPERLAGAYADQSWQ